jgi:hypothetical protein
MTTSFAHLIVAFVIAAEPQPKPKTPQEQIEEVDRAVAEVAKQRAALVSAEMKLLKLWIRKTNGSKTKQR